MSFDEPLLDQAYKDLELTEKLCSSSMKKSAPTKKVLGISAKTAKNSNNNDVYVKQFSSFDTLYDNYMKQIIIADCKLFKAILTFISQDITGYLRSGILQLRSSWKLYSRINKQLSGLYQKFGQNTDQLFSFDQSTVDECVFDETVGSDEAAKEEDESIQNTLNELNINEKNDEIDIESIKRLLGAVGFGYGMFQIFMSFMPPNYLKLFNILGFEGDRKNALRSIAITSHSKDMRSPFADMILLWYEIVAKVVFNTDHESNINTQEIESLLNKNLRKCPKSSLFLYFKGKYMRNILKDRVAAYDCYNLALENACNIRELQLMSVYEIGLMYMASLDYGKALDCFLRLNEQSKWSSSFHRYMCAILYGCLSKLKDSNDFIKNGLNAVKRKTGGPIEIFALKRLEYFKKNPIKTSTICEFMCLEINFLWSTMPFCHKTELNAMLEICDKQNDKSLFAMKCLFEAMIHLNLENIEFHVQYLNECLARSEGEKQISFSKYAQPFACYNLALDQKREKNYENAKQYLNKANGFKDYDFESRLYAQVKALLRSIQIASSAQDKN